jgi:hypothetical protein
MFSLAENLRIDPKIRKAYFRGNLTKMSSQEPPQNIFIWEG